MSPRHLTDHARLPAGAGAHQQGDTVLLQLHDLDHVGAERLADQPAGLVQNLVQVVGPSDLRASSPNRAMVSRCRKGARSRPEAILVIPIP